MPRPEIGVKGFIRCMLLLLTVTSAVGFSGPLHSQTPPGVQEFVYATVGGTPLWLDFLPATDGSSGPHPLIIFIHGGAWQSGVRQAVPGPILGFWGLPTSGPACSYGGADVWERGRGPAEVETNLHHVAFNSGQ